MSYYILENIISGERSKALAIEILANLLQFKNIDAIVHQKNEFGESQPMGNSFGVGAPVARLERFWNYLTPKVIELTGKNLGMATDPFFTRIYRNGSLLPRHVDVRENHWAMTVPLYSTLEVDWPIYIEQSDGKVVEYQDKVGSGILFNSIDLFHWRDKLVCPDDQFCVYLFLHWKDLDYARD